MNSQSISDSISKENNEDNVRLLKEVAELMKLEAALPVFVQRLRLAYIKAHDLSIDSSYDPTNLHYHKDMEIFIVNILMDHQLPYLVLSKIDQIKNDPEQDQLQVSTVLTIFHRLEKNLHSRPIQLANDLTSNSIKAPTRSEKRKMKKMNKWKNKPIPSIANIEFKPSSRDQRSHVCLKRKTCNHLSCPNPVLLNKSPMGPLPSCLAPPRIPYTRDSPSQNPGAYCPAIAKPGGRLGRVDSLELSSSSQSTRDSPSQNPGAFCPAV